MHDLLEVFMGKCQNILIMTKKRFIFTLRYEKKFLGRGMHGKTKSGTGHCGFTTVSLVTLVSEKFSGKSIVPTFLNLPGILV